MPKLHLSFTLLAGAVLAMVPVAGLSGSAAAASAGDAACSQGKPSVKVRVSGFKRGSGTVGVALWAQNGFLKKEARLNRVKVPVRSTAPVDVCLAVPRPGRYAVAVHHDLNGNSNRDRADGGGFSRNPSVSLLRLRPKFSATSIDVGTGTKVVPVRLQYLQGLRIAPVRS